MLKNLKWAKIAILLVIAVVIVFFAVSSVKIIQLNAEKNEVEHKNQELTEKKEDLEQELANIHTDKYIEHLARRDLKLVRGNELIFVLPVLKQNDVEYTPDEGYLEIDPKEETETAEGTDETEENKTEEE